jgi:hypothetical protein
MELLSVSTIDRPRLDEVPFHTIHSTLISVMGYAPEYHLNDWELITKNLLRPTTDRAYDDLYRASFVLAGFSPNQIPMCRRHFERALVA